jgi:two-component system, cell cycle sensor histidine kinase and response regulator CckA
MENTFPPSPPINVLPTSGKRSLQQTLLAAAVLLTLFMLLIFLFPAKAIRDLTAKSTDLILRTTHSSASGLDIVIVEIDESSLKKHGQWPWPRDLFARLLDTIKETGATSIGIDVIFPERDRSYPQSWQDSFISDSPSPANSANFPAEILDNDIVLANSLGAGPFILGYEFLFSRPQDGPTAECPISPVSLARLTRTESSNPHVNFYRANSVLCNYPPLTKAAPSSGFLNGAPDDDGVLRRLPLLMRYGDLLYPSFALAVLMRFHNQQTVVLETDDGYPNRLVLAGRHIVMDAQGNILLGPPSRSRPPRFSAADILSKTIDPSQLRQKIVLVGSTVSGLAQGYPTPYSSTETLLDLHAAAIRALDAKIQTVCLSTFPYYEAAMSLLLCLCLAIVTARWPTGWTVGFCLLSIVTSWVGAQALFEVTGFLFSPLLPSATIIFNGFLLLTLKFSYFQRQAKSETGKTLLLLKSSESSLKSILHTIPDIIFRLDDQGNIVFISPAICKYTKSPETLLGSSIFSHVEPTDRDQALFRLNERRTGERATFDLEIRLLLNRENRQGNENYRFFSISAEGLYRNDLPKSQGFLGTQGIAKDITDRKKLEFQLLQAQKMEVIGNLAAGIAHDLNNILSGLVSYPDLLLLEIPKNDPLHEKISIIQKSGKKAAAIVQDLLSLARRNITIPSISNMNHIITEYIESAEYRQLQLRHPNVVLHTNLAKNLTNINGSAVHLSKVIMNLLHNAMEAMPAGGRIIISTSNTFLEKALDGYEPIPAGKYACVSVADDGVGIPHSDLPRIFEPFFTRKAMSKSGTGLGMTIIWATVKDHQGYLDIRSREGQGTTLTVYLPATTKSADLPQHRMVLEDYLGSETVLVIDDDTEQRHITANMLEKLGYTVHTSGSGEKAVLMVEKQPVDLVILDMIMPGGMDGLETYQTILGIFPEQKAIITSGYSKSERVGALQDLGAGSFVQKPFTMEQIGMAVKTALAKPTERQRSPASEAT